MGTPHQAPFPGTVPAVTQTEQEINSLRMGAPAELVSVLVFLSTLAFAVHAGTRFSREVTEDDINDELEKAQGEIDGFFKKIWGAPCANENQCLAAPYIAYCDKSEGVASQFTGGLVQADGQCRPAIWVWIVLATIVLLFLGACICCCLCSCCSCLLDCLCCCCRNKGYSPAGPG